MGRGDRERDSCRPALPFVKLAPCRSGPDSYTLMCVHSLAPRFYFFISQWNQMSLVYVLPGIELGTESLVLYLLCMSQTAKVGDN